MIRFFKKKHYNCHNSTSLLGEDKEVTIGLFKSLSPFFLPSSSYFRFSFFFLFSSFYSHTLLTPSMPSCKFLQHLKFFYLSFVSSFYFYFFDFLILEIKCFFLLFWYFYFFECKFKVWRNMTNLIFLNQFFFIIISFFLFALYYVPSFN